MCCMLHHIIAVCFSRFREDGRGFAKGRGGAVDVAGEAGAKGECAVFLDARSLSSFRAVGET